MDDSEWLCREGVSQATGQAGFVQRGVARPQGGTVWMTAGGCAEKGGSEAAGQAGFLQRGVARPSQVCEYAS